MTAPGSWERAYGWAKAAGVMGSSFLGRRRSRLLEAKGVRDLYREVFLRDPPEVPEPQLISAAERELDGRLQGILQTSCPGKCSQGSFLHAARRRYEFENAKALYLSARAARQAPVLHELDSCTEIAVDAYPDLQAMFQGTRYEWLAQKRDRDEDLVAANRLDRQFYTELWAASMSLAFSERGSVRELILEEALLMNCAWALRLSITFGLLPEKIEPLLIAIPGRDVRFAAQRALSLPTQDRRAWEAWRYGYLALEGDRDADQGIAWSVEPRSFEAAVLRRLRKRFRRAFHARPGGISAIYAFIRIMEFEMDDLQSAFEAFRMGLPSSELRAFLGSRA